MPDETSERHDGPTPNGGTHSVANWLDAERKPCPKDRAVHAEIIEYDADDEQVARTWLTLKGAEPEGLEDAENA